MGRRLCFILKTQLVTLREQRKLHLFSRDTPLSCDTTIQCVVVLSAILASVLVDVYVAE